MMPFLISAFIYLLFLYGHTYHNISYFTIFNTLLIPSKSMYVKGNQK